MYINVKSPCCTPETNIILYVTYISFFKKAEEKIYEKEDLEFVGRITR